MSSHPCLPSSKGTDEFVTTRQRGQRKRRVDDACRTRTINTTSSITQDRQRNSQQRRREREKKTRDAVQDSNFRGRLRSLSRRERECEFYEREPPVRLSPVRSGSNQSHTRNSVCQLRSAQELSEEPSATGGPSATRLQTTTERRVCRKTARRSSFHDQSPTSMESALLISRRRRQISQQRRRRREANNNSTVINSILPLARQRYTDPVQRFDLGSMDVVCPFCSAYHWIGEKVSNSPLHCPQFKTCCQRGRVQLRPQSDPPRTLYNLLENDDEEGNQFRMNIRQYNMALAFTSLGVSEDKLINRRGGWVFRVQGELCHLIGSLRPNNGEPPSFAQLYIYDARLALAHRMNRNDNLSANTMNALQCMLQEHHQYSTTFKHAYEILQQYPRDSDANITMRVAPGTDRRRYNLSTAEDIAIILPGDGSAPERRDILLHRRTNSSLSRINDAHPAYAPLHYVLLFPNGDNGWHWDLQHRQTTAGNNRPRITQTQYSSFRLHTHQREYSTIHRGKHLLQQYIVDMWASADQTRLAYLHFNQRRLRATLYSGLEDSLTNDDVPNPRDLGKRAILPSSYIGGPRHQQQRYQDAMTIARFFKRIDLFITMTANPHWDDVTRELLPGQTSYDRPDLVARVFKLKKDELLDDIFKRKIFGHVPAYVYVIEFQKRGLPHLHLLIVLDGHHRLRSPEDIDSCISAQWPDPTAQPLLFQTIKATMIHGPCGNLNSSAPCMRDGKCTKDYPKPFQSITRKSDDSYPLYARPNDGRSYPIPVGGNGSIDLDNRWIVPYNPYLSGKYHCHINVESVATFRTVKYCFKYIHKGPDRATMEYEHDEIKQYIDGRYIGAPEGIWRIFHYDVHKQIPSIERLQIHLPGQHMVVFDPDEPIDAILSRAATERTTLTQFFYLNSLENDEGRLAREQTYEEIPHHFVWHKDTKTWTKRQRGYSLGRMYFIPPTAGEIFYLRTLLTIVRGAKSYKDLRTYDGTEHATFQEACCARGLLEDDGEWRLCLSDASTVQSGSRLRYLFATMLQFCNISSPHPLWLEFREHICDDLHWHVPNPTLDRVYDYGLFLLNCILAESGYTLENFPDMPLPHEQWNRDNNNRFISEQLDYDCEQELQVFQQHMENIQRIPEQLFAFQTILDAVNSQLGRVFFLHGPGGTGKTYVYNAICHNLRSTGKIVLCVASSGVAALLLPGGRTAHSTFRIPIDCLDGESSCNISKQDKRADLLKAVDLIIWDEAPMQSRFTHEALDHTLRDICDNDSTPFGGKTIVFGGDFQQTLPVLPNSSPQDIISISLPRSYLWRHVTVLPLRTNMRLLNSSHDQLNFAEWLLDVGHGRNIDEHGTISFNPEMRVPDLSALINAVYPNIENTVPPPTYFSDRVILAPRNCDVDDINSSILLQFPGDESLFYSADSILHDTSVDDGTDAVPVEFLRSRMVSGLPPGELHLKKGCPLILLRNLAPSRGLCNGTRMIFVHATHRVLHVKILGGEHDGEDAFIPRISLSPSTETGLTFRFRRRQFPVRLAFALTINKAQGQSVRHIGLDLREPVFAHGQLYVALSRATSSNRIKILLPHTTEHSRIANTVYPEIFQLIGDH